LSTSPIFCAHRARPGRGSFELACNISGRELGVLAVVPFDLECGKPLLRSAHVIRHHGDRVIEPDDLADAPNGLGRDIIHALHAPAKHRRLCERCDLHPGWPRVDAIVRRAVDLGRRVEPLRGRADQLEISGLL